MSEGVLNEALTHIVYIRERNNFVLLVYTFRKAIKNFEVKINV